MAEAGYWPLYMLVQCAWLRYGPSPCCTWSPATQHPATCLSCCSISLLDLGTKRHRMMDVQVVLIVVVWVRPTLFLTVQNGYWSAIRLKRNNSCIGHQAIACFGVKYSERYIAIPSENTSAGTCEFMQRCNTHSQMDHYSCLGS